MKIYELERLSRLWREDNEKCRFSKHITAVWLKLIRERHSVSYTESFVEKSYGEKQKV